MIENPLDSLSKLNFFILKIITFLNITTLPKVATPRLVGPSSLQNVKLGHLSHWKT
jgi:hypothetical protein